MQYMFCDPNILRHDSGGSSEGATSGVGQTRHFSPAPTTSDLPRILLQKSFCIDQHKFSGPYARRSNNHLRDYIICDELTGDFGNGLEATSVGDLRLVSQFAGN